MAAHVVNLSDVYVFKKVASTLSFTEAARQTGVTRSAVSKQVKRLENSLGVVLINRSTRSISLTEAGRIFDFNTSEIDITVERALELVRDADVSPIGTVACSLPTSLGAALMPKLITRFESYWPDLRLNLQFDDFSNGIIDNNLDLAIRVSRRLSDSSLVAKRLASTRIVLAASPKYIGEKGTPERASDLQNHRCLALGTPIDSTSRWRLLTPTGKVSIEFDPMLSANSELGLIQAACMGAGIIRTPEICIGQELRHGRLQRIDNICESESAGIYALYPRRAAAAKVKVLVDFIEQGLAEIASPDRPLRPRSSPDRLRTPLSRISR